MRKEEYKKFDFARRYTDDMMAKKVIREKSVEVSQSASDSLLSIVYAMDEVTNLPKGDLSYLVSDKANPQVKEFILNNLMRDVSGAKNVTISGLSDDDLLALSRNPNESVADYANRLNDSISRDKWMMDEYKKSISNKSKETPVSTE